MNKRKRTKKAVKIPGSNWVILFLLPLLLSLVGLIFVFEASSVRGLTEVGDSFHYLKLQLQWIFLGVFCMAFFSYFNFRNLYYMAFPLMAIVIVLLVIVLIPTIGHQVGGARSWINFGFFNVQPTEFAKFATIIYLASWFSGTEKRRFLPFISLLGFLMLLILLQPDMGTALIIFFLSITIYFIAGKELRYLFLLVPVSVVGFLFLIIAAPYRMRRLTAFLNPSEDPGGVGYHINQILISLSQGGIFGQGFGASRQKYLFLPEAHTDSIFAIYGEELGFIGSVLLIFLYTIFLYKIYQIYSMTSDRFARLLIGGIFAYFGFQIIINLGGMVNLMPLTGVTLPFISYGGSHILISFALIGIIMNIAKKAKR